MLITSICAHFWRQAEDAVGALVKSFSLRKTEELEVHTGFVLLHAGLVQGLLALELGRAVDD